MISQILLHLTINLAILTSVSPDAITSLPCSSIICENRHPLCKILDQLCSCDSMFDVQCPSLSPKPFWIWYENNVRLTFFGVNEDINVTNLRPLFILADHLKATLVEISGFCTDEHWSKYSKNKSQIDNIFNFDQFPLSKWTKKLELSSSCLTDLRGDFLQWMPNVQELKLNTNKLWRIPDNIKQLLELTKLDLQENFLSTIVANDVNNFKFLVKLNLQYNFISELPEDLLQELTELEEVILDHNSISTIPEALLKNNFRLLVFSAACNNIKELSPALFASTNFLEKVILNENKLKQLPDGVFNKLENLVKLELSHNQISTLPPDIVLASCPDLTLREIYLSQNSFTQLPFFRINASCSYFIQMTRNDIKTLHVPLVKRLGSVSKIVLSDNCIENIVSEPIESESKIGQFYCHNCCLSEIHPQLLEKVDYAYLNNNNISEFNIKTMLACREATSISLDSNQVSILNFTNFNFKQLEQFNFSTQRISLDDNPINCDCHLIDFLTLAKSDNITSYNVLENLMEYTFCQSPSNLQSKSLMEIDVKELYCNYTTNCPNLCKCTVKSLENPQFIAVNCGGVNLTELPNLDNYHFTYLKLNFSNCNIKTLPTTTHPIWDRIIELDLSHNQLKSIANLTVKPNLQLIQLNNNELTVAEPPLTALKNNTTRITLSNNPWVCNCLMRNVILNVNLLENRNTLKCNVTYNFIDLADECAIVTLQENLQYAYILTPIVCLLVLTSAFTVVFYRYKQEIYFWLYAKEICLTLVTEEDIDGDKLFDAFVSYSTEDERWVADFLVSGLEEHPPFYKLCLHGRDWVAGSLISDLIVQSVENSRRTILVLTDNYLKSVWSRVEFDVAYQQSLKEKVRRVLVVVPGDVPDLSEVGSEFRTFITMSSYLEVCKPYFWRKLRSSMPRVRGSVETGV